MLVWATVLVVCEQILSASSDQAQFQVFKEKYVVWFNIFETKSIIPVNFFSTNSRQDGWITSVYILKLCLLKKAVRCVIKTTVRAALSQVFWLTYKAMNKKLLLMYHVKNAINLIQKKTLPSYSVQS